MGFQAQSVHEFGRCDAGLNPDQIAQEKELPGKNYHWQKWGKTMNSMII